MKQLSLKRLQMDNTYNDWPFDDVALNIKTITFILSNHLCHYINKNRTIINFIEKYYYLTTLYTQVSDNLIILLN